MTDNYIFNKAMEEQDLNEFSKFTKIDYLSINDLNSGVYNNNGLTQVLWDLSSIYNSGSYTDTNLLYITCPIIMCASYSTNNGTLIAPPAGSSSLLCMKSMPFLFIHLAQLEIGGKTIHLMVPYIDKYTNWKLLSELSMNDKKQYDMTYNIDIDNPKSLIWNGKTINATATSVKGTCNGFSNNIPYGISKGVPGTLSTISASEDLLIQGLQNSNCINGAIQRRISKIVDVTNNVLSLYGDVTAGIMTLTLLNQEYTPNYYVSNSYMIWLDLYVIKLCDLFPFLSSAGLVKRLDMTLRIYFNTGQLLLNNTVGTGSFFNTMTFDPTASTFTNTCPIMVNNLGSLIPDTTTKITAGIFIGKVPNYTIGSINLGASSVLNAFLASCRVYYSQCKLLPLAEARFLSVNRNKKVIYRDVLSNQYTNINGNFSLLIQSGVRAINSVIILPFYSASNYTSNGFLLFQSPFDPALSGPISLINLQVMIGGNNELLNTFFSTTDMFLQQQSIYELLSLSDWGVNVGLYNQLFLLNNRFYVINCERGNEVDKLTPRNVVISFTNNTNVLCDILVFVVYNKELILDCETGLIKE